MSHLQFSKFDSQTMLDKNQTITLLPEWRPAKLLELAQSTNDESVPVKDEGGEEKLLAAPRDVVEVIYRYGQHPAEVQITAELSETSVLDVVARLATAAELQVIWSDGASASVKRRSLAFNSMPVTLAVALDRVLDIFGLTWSVSDDQLTIAMLSERTEEELVELNREVSGRLLRHAIATHTEHPLSVYGYMALGNLAFEQHAYSGAISVYDQFEEKYPRAPDLVVVQYNRGKAYLKEQQREAAILSFFQSADGGHGHPLQSSANVFAGELLLEAGKIADAPRALIRAVSSATTPEHKARPILSLAAAYLLADNAHAAAQVLMEGRDAIKAREDMKHLAAFANCYAQFKVAKDQLDILRAGRNLVDTLSDLPEVGDLGDYWHLLIGAAFREVGLSSQMVTVYQSALKKNISEWVATEIGEQLVAYWKLNGDHEAMRTWLLENQSSIQSSLRLAEVSLRGERYEECRNTCRELLKHDAAPEQKQQALRLLGLAYQGEGEHYKAALCFAGMLPGEQPGSNPEPTSAADEVSGGKQKTNPDPQRTRQ
jgi:tetratricopeptide (TPR) repeat protein